MASKQLESQPESRVESQPKSRKQAGPKRRKHRPTDKPKRAGAGWAMTFASPVAWALGLLFILMAILTIAVPAVGGFLSSNVAVLLLLSGGSALAVGFLVRGPQRLLSNTSAVLSDIQSMANSDEATALPPARQPELAPLIESVNQLIDRAQSHDDSSSDLRASNRVLARELTCVFRLLDSLGVGLIGFDSVRRVIFANRFTADFLNAGPEEVRGQLLKDCLTHPRLIDLMRNEESKGGAPNARTVELPPDEKTGNRHVSVTLSRNLENDSESGSRLLILQDVTHLKNVEKMQIEFVDTVAHEFRTPLASVLAYVEMLIDGEASDPEAQNTFYNVIYEETYRLSQMIDNILNISRLESGLSKLDTTPTRLKKVLESAIEMVRPQCEKKSVKLLADLPDRLPTLNVDKSLFSMAIINILGNAVKYTPAEGTVKLWTLSRENEFLIHIRDTGIGIAEEDLPRIFEKFYRCPNPEIEEITGSGLGLATSLKIVRLHGGDIQASSKLGEGSQFTIVLPRSLINTSVGD